MNRALAVVTLLAAPLVACEKQGANTPPPAVAEVAPKPAARNLDVQPTHPGPTYTLDIKKSDTDPPTYTVTWTAAVDSGGWAVVSQTNMPEESMGKMVARLWVVIGEPMPDTEFSKEPTTISGSFDAGTQKIDAAELNVKHTVLDSKPTYQQLFTVVKTTD